MKNLSLQIGLLIVVTKKVTAEVATGGVLKKTVFLKISQITLENTCVGVSF